MADKQKKNERKKHEEIINSFHAKMNEEREE